MTDRQLQARAARFVARLAALDQKRLEVMEQRDDLIALAVAEGRKKVDVARAFQVTKARVGQIIDERARVDAAAGLATTHGGTSE